MQSIHFPGITLIQGDAYELIKTTYLKNAAIVTDPPYLFNNSGGGHFRKARFCANEIAKIGLCDGFDYSIIKSSADRGLGSIMIFCHNDQIVNIMAEVQKNFHRTCLISYHKTNPVPFHNKHYVSDTEYIIHGWQEGFEPVGNDFKRYILETNGQQKEFNHPTVKNIKVMEKLVSNANSRIIIDPFMGTGTTGQVALSLGKRFIGFEKDKTYFDMAVARFKNLGLQEITFDSDDDI